MIRFDAGRKFDYYDEVVEFEDQYQETDNLDDTVSSFEFDSVSQVGQSSMVKYKTGEYKFNKKGVKPIEIKKVEQLYPAGFDIRRIVNPNPKF